MSMLMEMFVAKCNNWIMGMNQVEHERSKMKNCIQRKEEQEKKMRESKRNVIWEGK